MSFKSTLMMNQPSRNKPVLMGICLVFEGSRHHQKIKSCYETWSNMFGATQVSQTTKQSKPVLTPCVGCKVLAGITALIPNCTCRPAAVQAASKAVESSRGPNTGHGSGTPYIFVGSSQWRIKPLLMFIASGYIP